MKGSETLWRELRTQRCIYEIAREKAKQDLTYANKQILRIDRDFHKYFAASAIRSGVSRRDGATRLDRRRERDGNAGTPKPHHGTPPMTPMLASSRGVDKMRDG